MIKLSIMFKCPHCSLKLTQLDHAWICQNKHSFDVSKQGYTHLLVSNSSRTLGDHPDMIRARHAFLNAGYYAFLRDALVDSIAKLQHERWVDLGCGEGYYTNALSNAMPTTQWVGLDLSKSALKIASKASKVHYFCASIAETPLMNKSVDGALCIFAPFVLDEIHRIVKTNGYFISVNPGPRHLYGLKAALYNEVRLNPVSQLTDNRFKLVESQTLTSQIVLETAEMIQNLLTMTPYRFKTKMDALVQLSHLCSLTTELSFTIDIYQVL